MSAFRVADTRTEKINDRSDRRYEAKIREDESGKGDEGEMGGRRRQDYKGWGLANERFSKSNIKLPPHHFLLSDCILVFLSCPSNLFREKEKKISCKYCFAIARPGYWIAGYAYT